MSKIRFADIPTPALPAAGKTWLYIDETDGHVKTIDSGGTVFDLTLSGGGSGGGVDDINSLLGAVTLAGAGEVIVTTAGQTITISGTPHETDTDTNTVSDAIIGGIGIVVTSGTSTTTIDGHLRYTSAENDAIIGGTNVTVVSGANTITISATGGGGGDVPNALVGADGITVSSGVSVDTITGFRTEFVSASGTLQDQIDTAGGDLPGVQARRTTDLVLTSSFVDLTFDTTDVENDTAVLEHDDVNTDRIKIKETGLYLVQYNFTVESTVEGQPTARVRINDTTVISGSEMAHEDANDQNHIGNDFLCNCAVNDFLTLQVKQTAGAHTIKRDTILNVIKLRGSKGDKGDPGTPGSGSTINVSKDDVLVASGIGDLNFEGSVSVIDEGGGKATVTISGTGGGSAFPPGWVNKGRVSFVSVTQVSIGKTGIISSVRDAADSFNISWSGVLTAAITSAGAGGLDTGSEAADTWYAIHVIADSSGTNSVNVLLSTSETAPTLPAGYDKFRRLGWVRNDATGDFIRFSQTWAGNDRTYMYDIPVGKEIEVLNNGTATSFTAVDLGVAVPPTSRWAHLQFDFQPSSASQDFAIRPSDFVNADRTTAPFLWQTGDVLTTEARTMFWIECDDNQSIDYIQSNVGNTLDIIIVGFREEI